MKRLLVLMVTAIAVSIAGLAAGAHASSTTPPPNSGSGPPSPIGRWSVVAHCTSGWCAGQDIDSTIFVDTWDPSTEDVTAHGNGDGSTGSGTYVNGELILHEVTGAKWSNFDVKVTPDGLRLLGTWTDSSGGGGTSSFLRVGGPTARSGNSGSVALSPIGEWKGDQRCTSGTCGGQVIAIDLIVSSWNRSTNAITGTINSSAAHGQFLGGNSVEFDPNWNPDAWFDAAAMSLDGGSMSATGTDSVGGSWAVLLLRVGGPQITTTTTVTASTVSGSSTTVEATSSTTVGAVATTVPPTTSATGTSGGKRLLFPPPSSGRSLFLNIPNPTDALTAKNIAEAAALSLLLMLLIVFPSTLFNNTLDANLDVIRGWLPAFLRARDEPDEPTDEPVARSFWHTWWGFATFMVAADVLYSLMQPGWGFNRGTAHTLLGFMAGTMVSTFTGITITRRYLRRRYGKVSGHMEVEMATLAFAVICVIASRLANFVPGYFYGVIAAYEPSLKPSVDDSGRIRVRSIIVTFGLAIFGWVLFAPLRSAARHGGFVTTLPLGLVGGLVTGALDFAVIGLLPLRFLPGAALKQWNPKVWLTAYSCGMFLFTLVLLHPGLVSAPAGQSVAWTIGIALFFAAGSIGFWWYFKERAKREEERRAPSPSV